MRERVSIAASAEDPVRLAPSTLTATLSGNRTITAAEIDTYTCFSFDPGGSGRTITLPAEADCVGVFCIVNNTADGAEILTINNDAASAVCTPTQNEAAFLFCDGTTWFGIVGANN